jgi:UTP-glucose-1-phosphate uridylyltransferase
MRQRHEKIVKYMMKKRMKGQGKKFTYECRKQVAEKRLRIKGRFVTKDQAFEILGLKKDDLRTTDCLQKLLEQHYNINQMQQYNTEVPYTSHIAQIMRHQLSQQNGAI